MKARICDILLTSDGQSLRPSGGVTLIVGPNNSGKSQLLREVGQLCANPNITQPGLIVRAATPRLPTGQDYIKAARLANAEARQNGRSHSSSYSPFPEDAAPSDQELALRTSFGALHLGIVKTMSPDRRADILTSVELPDLMALDTELSGVPKLYWDRDLSDVASSYMQRAFGEPLFVNRHSGGRVHLQIGHVDIEEPNIGVQSSYSEATKKLPRLSGQGAGIQAFMGTVLSVLLGEYSILLLDEPETFLHPPQAYLLGQVLAEISHERGVQVIAVTHSRDFAQGALNGSKDRSEISIARLTRPTDGTNRVAQIDPGSVSELRRDPLLRYSSILDGVFYKGVVLCEGDSDCTYYFAVLEHIESSQEMGASDLLFTHCGGKDRFVKAISALQSVAVPTAVIADSDVLSDRNKFRDIYETLIGPDTFSEIESDYNCLEAAMKPRGPSITRQEYRSKILEILDSRNGRLITAAELTEICSIRLQESGWRSLKFSGRGAIPSGSPTESFDRILAKSRAGGLFILKVGELEKFHREEPSGNKARWLRSVLENGKYQESQAAELLSSVRAYISENQ